MLRILRCNFALIPRNSQFLLFGISNNRRFRGKKKHTLIIDCCLSCGMYHTVFQLKNIQRYKFVFNYVFIYSNAPCYQCKQTASLTPSALWEKFSLFLFHIIFTSSIKVLIFADFTRSRTPLWQWISFSIPGYIENVTHRP